MAAARMLSILVCCCLASVSVYAEAAMAGAHAHSAAGVQGTPITRVVNLLKEMQKTLSKEMAEDEDLYKKLACWCNNNEYQKTVAIEAAQQKITELEASIEELSAKSASLKAEIKQTEKEVAENKEALAKATAIREKEAEEFHSMELDTTQALENLKAAIAVLSRHHEAAFPQLALSLLSIDSEDEPSEDELWSDRHESSLDRSFDDFLRHNEIDEVDTDSVDTSGRLSPAMSRLRKTQPQQRFLQQNDAAEGDTDSVDTSEPSSPAMSGLRKNQPQQRFLQQNDAAEGASSSSQPGYQLDDSATGGADLASRTEFVESRPTTIGSGWSISDVEVVHRALKSANIFLQAHQRDAYYPAYGAQSGEILGILKQLEEEMSGNLQEAQEAEKEHLAAFEELRAAKTQIIEQGAKMVEKKEDELAQTDNDLAEAKEDLEQVEKQLEEDQKFLKTLKKTCAEGDSNFEQRKKMRLAEINAISETIELLTEDEARDAMSSTYSFIQVSAKAATQDRSRCAAAKVLRRAAATSGQPAIFSALATSAELDPFIKVKKAIDGMIASLNIQQEDESKRSDYCKDELHSNEMANMKTKDLKSDLEAKSGELENRLSTLDADIEEAKQKISALQVNLQTASEARVKESHDFQKTVENQMVTQVVLKAALQKLATFYETEAFMQVRSTVKRQTPPVQQMEYKPSEGAAGVMSMIEKLIYEAKEMTAESKKSEYEAQAAYEKLIADTNGSVGALQAEVVSKTQARATSQKEAQQTEADLDSTVNELEGLAKYEADLHDECDYVLKNFSIRRQARQQEVEALQQAKQILSGGDFS